MADVLGYRRVFGVIGPSTNTVVQPDFDALRVPGVTSHYSRIFVTDPVALSDADFIAGTQAISDNTLDAVRSVMTCKPDYLVMGMSAITFYGGVAGGEVFRQRVVDVSGVPISIGSAALVAALRAYGTIRRVAFLSPYYPVANAEVRRYLNDSGFEVVRDVALECRCWTDIARVPPERLAQTLADLDGPDVDALIQVGTNLSMLDVAAATEAQLGKPVVAINAATWWHALRTSGIDDKVHGYGRLLSEF